MTTIPIQFEETNEIELLTIVRSRLTGRQEKIRTVYDQLAIQDISSAIDCLRDREKAEQEGRLLSLKSHQPSEAFKKGLENLINEHNQEAGSNTPDFILSEYLSGCLLAFNIATTGRERWVDSAAIKNQPTQ